MIEQLIPGMQIDGARNEVFQQKSSCASRHDEPAS